MCHYLPGKVNLYMNGKKKTICLFVLLISGVIISVTFFLYRKNGWFLPSYITWNASSEIVSFGAESVQVTLDNKMLSIKKDGELIYQTADDVFVSDVYCVDIDRDSALEVCMMVWKKGSFGEHKPFWITEDTDDYTQHIFLYRWDSKRADRLDPMWMSSDLGMSIQQMSIDEYNRIHLIDKNGLETTWAWGNWGLVSCD